MPGSRATPAKVGARSLSYIYQDTDTRAARLNNLRLLTAS
jgi:hypothetical protein